MSLLRPFPGLRPFEAADQPVFFGRESQVSAILRQVEDHRFVAVVGSSGSGKSSLVGAGLLPALREGFLFGATDWVIIPTIKPGNAPYERLAAALCEAESTLHSAASAEAEEDKDAHSIKKGLTLATLQKSDLGLVNALQNMGLPQDRRVMVVIDQFEEVFAFRRATTSKRQEIVSRDEAAGFVKMLLRSKQETEARIWVVLTMRSDFIGNCEAFLGLPEAVSRSQFLVPRLNRKQMEEAIVRPGEVTTTAFQPFAFQQDLVNRIINDAGDRPDQLPMMQHALMRTWKLAVKRNLTNGKLVLTHDDYENAGQIEEALSKDADDVWNEIKSDQKKAELARRLFLLLCDVSPDRQITRRRPHVSEIMAVTGATVGEIEEVVREFQADDRNFLLPPSEQSLAPDIYLDISHEALLRQWHRFSKWLERERTAVAELRRLVDGARLYREKGGALLQRKDLDRVSQWQKDNLPSVEWAQRYVTSDEWNEAQNFIEKSAEDVKQREAAAQERKQRELDAAIALAAVEARAKEALAGQTAIRDVLSHANVSLARYSKDFGKNAQALAHLAQALRLNHSNSAAADLAGAMLTQTSWPILLAGPMCHDRPVYSAQFSPDGQRVVTASGDKTARLWEADSGKLLSTFQGHSGPVTSAVFSPDGQRVVTASEDNTARLWDALSGKPLGEPMRHGASVRSALFSPDGQRVLTSNDKTARLWDALSGKPLGEPMRHGARVYSARFSLDGQRVVTASGDTARLWDALSGKPIGELMGHVASVRSAQFSPDGRRVVTASEDNTARLWDALSDKPIGEPMGHGASVRSAQFSPDGQRVVTASEDNTARLWDALSGKPLGEPMRHGASVRSALFSPDGQRVVTASEDNTARLWDGLSGWPIGDPMQHGAGVYSAQFSPNGQRVVTASGDNTARLCDALSGKLISEPMQHGAAVTSAQFSLDGQRVVTASGDTARLWDALSGKPIGEPMRHGDTVTCAQFSPEDGQRVVTASGDTARLWDALSGKPLGEPMRHGAAVTSAQFSLDGQRVVTASGDTARLWDALSGKPLGEPMRHGARVYSARFSLDGQRVVTASGDDTAQLWDALSGKPIGEPMQHRDTVTCAQFSPEDGQRVVTASGNTARLWDALSGKPIGEPMRHGDTVTCAQFSPEDGQRVVTASGNTARLWDALSGKPIGEPMRHGASVRSALFSPDGRRVVTASGDNTARLWDALSGKLIGEPMQHGDTVRSAQFSPDGQRVVTASDDNTARLWDFPTISNKDSAEDVLVLADLAEATGGISLQTSGQEEIQSTLTSGEIQETREKIATRFSRRSAKLTPLQRLLKWSVSDPRNRTISPCSEPTVAEWIENTINEGTLYGLRAALQMDPANARLAAHLSLRLADQALETRTDPDTARRARAEADFQTRRALNLAPDNDEIKKLHAEVVKLLGLPE